MIRYILVPTDFSENAMSAFRYGAAVARIFGAAVRLAHAYAPFHSGFQSEEANEDDRIRAENEARQEMDDFIRSGNEHDVEVQKEFFKGQLPDAMEQWCARGGADLVIMGTKGSSQLKHTLLGSNSLDAVRSSAIPVIVVPLKPANLRLEKIAFFTDYSDDDRQAVGKLGKLFGPIVSEYVIFHIHESGEPPIDGEFQKLEEWTISLSQTTKLGKLSWELVHGSDKATLLSEVAARPGIDLLVLTVNKKSFFEKLVNKSFVKSVIRQPSAPILLLRTY